MMIKCLINPSTLLITCITLIATSGCGGSGSSNPNAITYSGVTTQAAITLSNGEEIAAESFQNGTASATLGNTPLSIEIESVSTRSKPRLYSLTKTLNKALGQIDIENTVPNVISGATVSESNTLPGGCGGSGSYSITVDDVSGNFSGTFSFSNFCENDETLSGAMTFAGTFNQNSLSFSQITMTFTNLTTTDINESTTLSGSITTPGLFANPAVLTANLIIKDNNTDQTYKTENLVISLYDGFTYEELEITGRLYSPDHGFVNITTPTRLYYTGSDDYPYPGIIVATGMNGSSTTLTSLSTTTYQLDIDEEGGISPDSTITGNWVDL